MRLGCFGMVRAPAQGQSTASGETLGQATSLGKSCLPSSGLAWHHPNCYSIVRLSFLE